MEQDGSGKLTLSTGEEVLYSGNENEKGHHTKRVTIMLSKKAKSSLVEWESANEKRCGCDLKLNAKILPSYNALHQPTRLKRRILTYL